MSTARGPVTRQRAGLMVCYKAAQVYHNSEIRKITIHIKMKASVLISIVAAGRQARDTQLLFNEMVNNNNVQEKTFFSETDSILLELQFYLQSSGLVQDLIPMIIYRWNKDLSI